MLADDLSTITRLRVPVLLFLGRHDVNLSSAVAAEWLGKVQAPSKQLICFKRSGHHITREEPGKLVTHARPIAAAVGDATP